MPIGTVKRYQRKMSGCQFRFGCGTAALLNRLPYLGWKSTRQLGHVNLAGPGPGPHASGAIRLARRADLDGVLRLKPEPTVRIRGKQTYVAWLIDWLNVVRHVHADDQSRQRVADTLQQRRLATAVDPHHNIETWREVDRKVCMAAVICQVD